MENMNENDNPQEFSAQSGTFLYSIFRREEREKKLIKNNDNLLFLSHLIPF